MPVQPNDVVRCVVNCLTPSGDDCKNVWHARHSGSVNVDDADWMAAFTDRLEAFYSEFADRVSSEFQYVDLDFYNITRDISMGSFTFAFLTSGSAVDAPLPPQVSALLTFPTTTTQSAGRKFLGGFTEASNDGDGVLTAAVAADLAAAVAILMAQLVIESQLVRLGNWNPTLGRWAVWALGAVDMIWATQRRRKPGVGS